MSVYKLNIKPLLAPEGAGLAIGKVNSVIAPEGAVSFDHELQVSVPGMYRFEYWAIDEAQNEEDHRVFEFNLKSFQAPEPIPGAFFDVVVTEATTAFKMVKGNFGVVFKKSVDGLGVHYSWTDLDVSGFVIENDTLEIKPGSYLFSQMVERFRMLDVEMSVPQGMKLKIILSQEFVLSDAEGNLLADLPKTLQGYVKNVRRENNRLNFTMLKPAKYGFCK